MDWECGWDRRGKLVWEVWRMKPLPPLGSLLNSPPSGRNPLWHPLQQLQPYFSSRAPDPLPLSDKYGWVGLTFMLWLHSQQITILTINQKPSADQDEDQIITIISTPPLFIQEAVGKGVSMTLLVPTHCIFHRHVYHRPTHFVWYIIVIDEKILSVYFLIYIHQGQTHRKSSLLINFVNIKSSCQHWRR